MIIKLPFIFSKSDDGKCDCGLEIDDKMKTIKKDEIVCHGCYNTFKGTFRGKYDHDRTYPNNQLTHVYKIEGLQCPYCGTVFLYHEFYHGIHVEGINNFIGIAKRTKVVA